VGNCGLDSSDSGLGPVVGPCERSNEPSGCIEGWEFIDRLSGHYFLHEVSRLSSVNVIHAFFDMPLSFSYDELFARQSMKFHFNFL